MIGFAAYLVENRDDAKILDVLRRDSLGNKAVDCHVDEVCSSLSCGLGGSQVGDGNADLGSRRRRGGRVQGCGGESGRLKRGKGFKLMSALGISCEHLLLKKTAGLCANLMYGREAHAAAVIEFDFKRGRLEGGGAHTANVLNQVGLGNGSGSSGLDGKTRRCNAKRWVV